MIQAVNQHIPCLGIWDWFRDERVIFAGLVRASGWVLELLGKATLCPLGLLSWEDVGHGGPPWRGLPETESMHGSNVKR